MPPYLARFPGGARSARRWSARAGSWRGAGDHAGDERDRGGEHGERNEPGDRGGGGGAREVGNASRARVGHIEVLMGSGGLDHRRRRGAPGAVRLRPRLPRGCAVARGFRGRRLRRDAARAAAAVRRQGLRRTRRCSAWSARCVVGGGAGLRLRGAGGAGAAGVLRRAPGFGVLDGLLGRGADGRGRARRWPGCSARSRCRRPGARELRREVQRSAILTELNDVLPSRELLNALERFDPFPRIDGPGRRRGAAAAGGHRARPAGARAAADSVVKILGTACGLGVEGSRLGGRRRARRHQRARGGRAGRHRGAARAARAGLDGDGGRLRRRATTSRCCGCDGLARRGAAAGARRRRSGTPRGDPRLPARRALPGARRPPRARRARSLTQDAYGAGPVRRVDHLAARRGPARQLAAGRWSTAAGASSRRSSRRRPAGRAAATASRTPSCARRSRGRARGRSSTGPVR